MKIKSLGRTGLKVSEVCLGTMTFANQADEPTSFAIMDVAREGGVIFFDTADVYPLGGGLERTGRTEEFVGRWIEDRGVREEIVLATKCRGAMGPGANDEGLSRKHILRACDESLRRLRTDYIDLYQVHAPDMSTPLEETLSALDSLAKSGKVRYIGCSNYPAWLLADAIGISERLNLARFDSVQPRYNLLFRMIEDELVPLCQAKGVGIMVYNPLAGGMLTGRYESISKVEEGSRFSLGHGSGPMYQRRYWNDRVLEQVIHLKEYFAGRGKSLTQVAVAWVLAQPGITSAIIGASKPDQLKDSLTGVDLTLDSDELAAIDEVWYALPRERDPSIARR